MTTQQSLSTSMVVGLALAILCGSTAASWGAEAAPPAVPRWQPRDFSFTANGAGNNPFQVGVSATVKGPDGKTFTLPDERVRP